MPPKRQIDFEHTKGTVSMPKKVRRVAHPSSEDAHFDSNSSTVESVPISTTSSVIDGRLNSVDQSGQVLDSGGREIGLVKSRQL